MLNEDQQAGPIISAIVLIAAVLFTANVYMIYSANKDVAVYEEAEISYNQAAAALLGLRQEATSEIISTTESIETTEN